MQPVVAQQPVAPVEAAQPVVQPAGAAEHHPERIPVRRRLWIDRAQYEAYYGGFANEGLWPLCHIAHVRPTFRTADWNQYVAVNRTFAAAAVDDLNGKEINGKKLYVKQFLNKADREQEIQRDLMKYKNSKKKCNLFVKNIPDNCTDKDIRDLFGKFGEIESVRLFPKEKGKNPYCFVCFVRPDNAQKAKEDLQNSDFMGRSL